MKHFGHEHPLILLPAVSSDKYCRICNKKIRGPSYACASSCDHEFYIHKSCGEVELEIQHHPLHPDHSLKLSDPRSSSMFRYETCNGCRLNTYGFLYQCRDCNFNLHLDCIYMSPSVQYEGHEHPLTLVEEVKGWRLECEACGYPIEDGTFALRCMQCCDLHFHVRCGPEFHPHQLPPAVVYAQHLHHPLSLITPPTGHVPSIPHHLFCDACKKERNPQHPFYRCDECGYSAHVRCVVTEKHVDREKLKHVGHQHYLNFHDEIAENTGDEGVLVPCDLCEKSVYHGTPTYNCATCKFSLHKSCAEVPTEIQHPLHPGHSLTLSRTSFYTPDCKGCRFTIRDNYYYRCQKCDFKLHINCVYMSPSVRYEGHDHPLTLVEKIASGTECAACGYDIEGTFYLRCEECQICFHVHECGPNPQHQLPPIIVDDDKHLHDHPLALITPDGDGVDEGDGFCDACKKERNPRHPFYKCAAELCDYSAHAHCLITEKPFDRKKLKHPGHEHYLGFQENYHDHDGDGDSILCSFCDKNVHQGTPAYSCPNCKFALHKSCGEIPLKIQYPFHSHPLHLFPLRDLTRGCGACLAKCNRDHGDRYVYCCSECDDPSFALHIECSSLLPTIKFAVHKHSLIYFDKVPGKIKCSKCHGSTSKNPNAAYLRCVSCRFTIHFYCIPFPKFINHRSHHHPLKLMDDLVDFNYDDQMCDVCEKLRNGKECAYYCADCFYVAEFKCVFDEVSQYKPEDEKMMRIINEGDPDEFTYANVNDFLSEEEIQEKNHIKESLKNVMEEIWEPLPEEGVEATVSISDKYPYSDKAMMRFFNRLYTSLPEETPDIEFFSFEDKLVDVKVWGYTTTRKLVPVLKGLMDKYSYFDAEVGNMSDNCKTLFITRLCGIVQSMRDTEVMKVEGYLLLEWWWQAKYVECAGFNVDFVFDQLKRIVCANYGTDTETYRNDEIYAMRKVMDGNCEQIEKLTKMNEELMERTRGFLSRGNLSTPLCLEDEVMSDLVQFRMRNAARGLL